MILQPLECSALPDAPQEGWLGSYLYDFQHRFISLLSYQFRSFPVKLAMQLLDINVVERVSGNNNEYLFCSHQRLNQICSSQDDYS